MYTISIQSTFRLLTMTTDCRLLNISLKQKYLVNCFSVIQDQMKRLEPILMEQQNFFLDKDKVASNIMSKEDIAALLKSFQVVDVLLNNMKTSLGDIRGGSLYLQRNLITFFQKEDEEEIQ